MTEETVPCGICGEETRYTGTKRRRQFILDEVRKGGYCLECGTTRTST